MHFRALQKYVNEANTSLLGSVLILKKRDKWESFNLCETRSQLGLKPKMCRKQTNMLCTGFRVCLNQGPLENIAGNKNYILTVWQEEGGDGQGHIILAPRNKELNMTSVLLNPVTSKSHGITWSRLYKTSIRLLRRGRRIFFWLSPTSSLINICHLPTELIFKKKFFFIC